MCDFTRLSWATGVAIARLVEDECGHTVNPKEVADYAEMARVRLALDTASVSHAMMFVQPLINMWAPDWKFAYTIALSLGTKFVTEGFHIIDIIDHLTNEYSLQALKRGERIAAGAYDWMNISSRPWVFRNALLSVALEQPRVGEAPPLLVPEVSNSPTHVLIVDQMKRTREFHRSLVLQVVPDARTKCCSSTQDAIDYFVSCRAMGEQVTLILLDVTDAESTGDQAAYGDGLTFTALLNAAMDAPTTGVGFKPVVAFVTEHHDWVQQSAELTMDDGSIGGADVLLRKPLNIGKVCVLVDGSSI